MAQSSIIDYLLYNYPGMRDLVTLQVNNNDRLKSSLDERFSSSPLEDTVTNTGNRRLTYQANKPLISDNFSRLSGRTISPISAKPLTATRYDQLNSLKANRRGDDFYTRFAGQLLNQQSVNSDIQSKILDAISYLKSSDEAEGFLDLARNQVLDAAKRSGVRPIRTSSVEGTALGKYMPDAPAGPTLLFQEDLSQPSRLITKIFGKHADKVDPEVQRRLINWDATSVATHELAHHLSNIQGHNEATLPDAKLFSPDGNIFSQTPSHLVREIHAELPAQAILQGNNPILKTNVPDPLRKLAYAISLDWVRNYLPAYGGLTPYDPQQQTARLQLPTKEERQAYSPAERTQKLDSIANRTANYIQNPAFRNQSTDAIRYFRHLL